MANASKYSARSYSDALENLCAWADLGLCCAAPEVPWSVADATSAVALAVAYKARLDEFVRDVIRVRGGAMAREEFADKYSDL